jgi:hypothetical protein
MAKKRTEETFNVSGKELKEKIKELLKEGNVRKITILDKNNKVILRVPLTFGVVGALIAPVFAAVAAVAALVTECTIKVEREE